MPAGVVFDLNIVLKVFEGDDPDNLAQWLFKGLRLIEMDALGGGSSRGSGQVVFENIILDGKPIDLSTINVL